MVTTGLDSIVKMHKTVIVVFDNGQVGITCYNETSLCKIYKGICLMEVISKILADKFPDYKELNGSDFVQSTNFMLFGDSMTNISPQSLWVGREYGMIIHEARIFRKV